MDQQLYCNWVKTERGDRVQITTRPDNTGTLFAEIPGSPHAMADAMIFAAAPELLEACRMILASAPDTRKGFPHWNDEETGERDYALALKAAYAAICKARGAGI